MHVKVASNHKITYLQLNLEKMRKICQKLLLLYHTMLGMCAPATGHLISKESLTFTRRSVKFCVSRGTSRAGGGVETELIGASESGRALQERALQG